MKEQLYQLFQDSMATTVSFQDLIIRVGMSLVLGLAIFLSYWLSHAGTIYSKKFNINLITLTVLTTTVMAVIVNNIALSLGMVGALSIVRFRTAIKDPRDSTYIFWAIICGICCGAGQYLIAAAGSGAVFVIMLILGRIRNDQRMLICIRCARIHEVDVEGAMYQYFQGRALQRVKNTTAESCEFIYEIARKALERGQENAERPITDTLYDLGAVEYVNIVGQSDEVGS